MVILYLHGFASGPGSFKARHFAARFAEMGVHLEVPALDEGDFTSLTLTRQLALVDRLAPEGEPTALIGSSLGGYVAALHAARRPAAGLVLLAPAVDFLSRWQARLPPEDLARWRREGRMEVFHHGLGRMAPIGWGLMEDARRHAPLPRPQAPALVLQGSRDEVVAAEVTRAWAESVGARFELLETGHEMVEVADELFDRALAFLAGLPGLRQAHPQLAGG